MNGHWVNSVKSHLNRGVKLRNQIIEEHNQLVEIGDIKKYRWRFQRKIPLLPKPSKDTPLFLNPSFHGLMVRTMDFLTGVTSMILDSLELQAINLE